MKKELSPRAFLIRTLVLTLAVLLFFGAVMFAVDPYQFYRKTQGHVLDVRYSTPGMIKHFDYSAALIGSSMCQNFDMDQLDALHGGEVLKLTKGGMTASESLLVLRWLAEAGKADTVYLGLDMTRFNEGAAAEYYPAYFANDDATDDWRYLFGYEAWMRYLPLNTAVLAANAAGIRLPSFITEKSDPDLVGRWMERYKNAFHGEAALVENYLNGKGGVSAQNTDGMYERMVRGLDDFLAQEPFDPDTTYYVFFSPYSALYWAHTGREGSLDALLKFRTHFFEKMRGYENVVALDFQAMDETRDLGLYKDLSHYHEDVNALMAEGFASGAYLATDEAVEKNNGTILQNVAELCEKYPELNEAL